MVRQQPRQTAPAMPGDPSAWAPVGVVTGLAVLDLALGGRAVLVGLLVVGPMLAAAWQGPRETLGIGAYAVVVSVLLGAPDGIWGTADHLFRSAGIAAGGGLAVWLAGHRVRHESQLAQVIRVAEVAQLAILRPLPARLGGVSLAARYRSAASESLVGGDMFEVVDTPWGIRALVGDVRGKGLDAVRTAALVLGAFRACAYTARDVSEVVEELDRCVARHVGVEDFVTALVAEVGVDTVRLANAGHPPPLRVAADGASPLAVEPTSPPLGLGARPVVGSFPLVAADRLVMFTDGLTEARDGSGRFFPLDAVAQALQGGDVEAAVECLLEAVDRHAGGPADDDLAVLVLERAPSTASDVPASALAPGADAVGVSP